ncbi:hypothetical protein PVAG01_02304 [Phlyctema vagabunda]|uniref:Integral membrane protein n=1 Tax=Phlyctema vagabunda TaxID=108571 RepID=A0ABR4PQQ1_9HELO
MFSGPIVSSFVPAPVPRAGLVSSIVLTVSSTCILVFCLSRKIHAIQNWRLMSLIHWLIIAIYVDSILFVVMTAVLSNGFGLNTSLGTCSAAIWMCLSLYMSSKILIYYLFVEKVRIVNTAQKSRLKSKLYLFNCFGMLVPYCIVAVLNLIFRISRFSPDGMCLIGMEKKAMIPLIAFDVVVNVYLTVLFIIPLRSQYSYQNNGDSVLRVITFRTFVGSVGTLTSSVANLTVIMVLQGEPAWICFICCNAEILFAVLVLHWVTNKDKQKAGTGSGASKSRTLTQCNTCSSVPLHQYDVKHGGMRETVSKHDPHGPHDPEFTGFDSNGSAEDFSQRCRSGSMCSKESQIPFGESLGQHPGYRTHVNAQETTGQYRRSMGGLEDGITLTKTIRITEQRSIS